MWRNVTADRVRQVRRFFKLRQRDLAALLGVSRRTVIRFEQRGGYIGGYDGDRINGAAWADLKARYDAAMAAGDSFGSPAELSPPAGARPREVTKPRGSKLRKTVTRPIGRRSRSRKSVTSRGRARREPGRRARGDKSRSRSVTRRGGRRQRGRGRR